MTDDNDAPFGAWLKQRRKALDLTQVELADRLGCSPVTITKIELGERRPSKQLADLLCEQLKIAEPDRARFVALARTGKALSDYDQAEGAPQPAPGAWQVSAPAKENAPSGAESTTVPLPLTPIIGREREIAAICALLKAGETRLVTLVGPPGIGKTRLATEVAITLQADFADGVFFVPLAAIAHASEVPGAIAHTLRLPDAEGRDAWESLTPALKEKHALLVLDNFEQVVDAAPHIADLLRACPNLRVLVTSREALRVRGEEQVEIEPLDLPDLSQLPPVSELTSYSGVCLFVQRAASARSEFTLGEENARDVAAICSRLDGLPLAIELVAARIQLLPPWALLARLGSSLALLTGGQRDMPARHRTLRTAIGWSYDLLTPEEQALFRKLALFAGGADLAAIEAMSEVSDDERRATNDERRATTVIQNPTTSDRNPKSKIQIPKSTVIQNPKSVDLLTLLESLINKSLVRMVEQNASLEPRYTMLQTIREFGLEKGKECGEDEEAMRRFVSYYASLLAEAEPHLSGPDAREWLDRLEREQDNIRVALDWLIARKDPLALRMCSPLWQLWEVRGYLNEAARWMGRALAEIPPSDSPERARVLHVCSGLYIRRGDFAGARDYSLKSLEIYERLGNKKGIGSAMQVLGIVEEALGNYPEAERYYNESIRLFRELGHKANLSRALNSLGVLERMRENYDRSVELFNESLALQQELGSKRSLALILANIGAVAVARKEWPGAEQLFTESLKLRRELGHKAGIGDCLIGLGFVAIAAGDLCRGVRLFAASDNIYSLLNYKMEPSDFPQYPYYLEMARRDLGEEEFNRAWSEGHSMSLEEALGPEGITNYGLPITDSWLSL